MRRAVFLDRDGVLNVDTHYLHRISDVIWVPGAKEAGVIFGTGTWGKDDVYRHPSLEQTYEMGKEL